MLVRHKIVFLHIQNTQNNVIRLISSLFYVSKGTFCYNRSNALLVLKSLSPVSLFLVLPEGAINLAVVQLRLFSAGMPSPVMSDSYLPCA